MGHTTNVLEGLAALLADAGIAVYRPDGVYEADEVGLTFTVMPDGPDHAVCLTPYSVDDTDLSDITEAIQVRMRHGRDPRLLHDLADAIRDQLHNRRGLVLGGVQVAVMWRQSQALMGQDAHGRQELTANYYYRATRPGPHLYE